MLEPPDFWTIPPDLWRGETVAILAGGKSITQAQVDHCLGRCRVVAINRAYVLAPWADMLWGADPGQFWTWCGGPLRINRPEPDAWEFRGLKTVLWSPELPEQHLEHLRNVAAAGAKVMRHRGHGWHTGVELDPGFVRGNNGVAQLVSSVLPQAGVAKIVLLGLDMVTRDNLDGSGRVDMHWHPRWPTSEPAYESEGGPRRHRAAIWGGGRELELGWYRDEARARQVEREYGAHIRDGCPQPAPGLAGIIPCFATMAGPLKRLGIDVVSCSPGSAVKAFRMGRLEGELP